MKHLVVLVITYFCALSASASLITLDTRALQFNPAPDYEASWNLHTSAITSTSLAAFTNIQSGNNSFSHLSVEFDFGSVTTAEFQFGLDAGFGASISLDSSLLTTDTTDIWWSLNWGHGDVLAVNLNSLSTGGHELDLYWAEGCCNGPSSGRFSTDGGNTYQDLSVANLDAAKVPEPTVIMLMGAGLFGMGLVRRKIRK